jgi:hypothetical protein
MGSQICALLNKFFEIDGSQPQNGPIAVKVHRQLMRADIVAEVGDSDVILIEDK